MTNSCLRCKSIFNPGMTNCPKCGLSNVSAMPWIPEKFKHELENKWKNSTENQISKKQMEKILKRF